MIYLILVDYIFLLFYGNSLSISPQEARLIYIEGGVFANIINLILETFGNSNITLRVLPITIHLFNAILIYKISLNFFKKPIDAKITLIIYLLLTGVNSSALLVNESGLIIFLTLLFIYYQNSKISYFILIFALFIDNSFAILYLSLFFYWITNRNLKLSIFALILFTISIYLFGFPIGGKPKNYFLDTIGAYLAIFSPLLFIYFFYSVYRIFIKENRDMLFWIAFVALIFSLLLSFRQKILIQDFAPFVVIATPLMVKIFMSSFRVRIKEHRLSYKILGATLFGSLFITTFFAFYNKPLYRFYKNPKNHFAYQYHIAYEFANYLKSQNIYSVNSTNRNLLLQLKFYGINSGGNYLILDDFEIQK